MWKTIEIAKLVHEAISNIENPFLLTVSTDTQSVTTSTASNRNLPPVAAISPGMVHERFYNYFQIQINFLNFPIEAQLEDWSQDASNQTQMRLADPFNKGTPTRYTQNTFLKNLIYSFLLIAQSFEKKAAFTRINFLTRLIKRKPTANLPNLVRMASGPLIGISALQQVG